MVTNYKSKYDTVFVTVESGDRFLTFLSIDNHLIYIDGVLYVRSFRGKEWGKRKVIRVEIICCKLKRIYKSNYSTLVATANNFNYTCRLSFYNPLSYINNMLYIEVVTAKYFITKYVKVTNLRVIVCKLVKK